MLGLSAAVTASLVQSVTYASRYYLGMTQQLPLIVPLLASVAICVVFGLINGFGVAKLQMHAFIITLGTQLIAFGANCIYIESQPSGSAQALSTFDRNFLNTAAGNLILGEVKIPLAILYFLALAVIMWVVWNKTRRAKTCSRWAASRRRSGVQRQRGKDHHAGICWRGFTASPPSWRRPIPIGGANGHQL